MELPEDKQLARLYDYTKFHIGIYLSFAGGIAALLGTENTGWFISNLVEPNKEPLYWALSLMILAGMCGGVVASSTIECASFSDHWDKPQGPRCLPILALKGKYWAALEHGFFWLSLLVLAHTVAVGFAAVNTSHKSEVQSAQPICCCVQAASVPACPAR